MDKVEYTLMDHLNEEHIDIWHLGNTGLRSPDRIYEGFKVFSTSPYVGNLHGVEVETAFMKLLNEKGIIVNAEGKDPSASHTRKWRLMFNKHGFVYPLLTKEQGKQELLGPVDAITPFGQVFLQCHSFSEIQECFLRSMSVEQIEIAKTGFFFSPLRWILELMLKLEERTGSSEISRIEFALWGHTTNPSYDENFVVDKILDLRERRLKAESTKIFDKQEIAQRAEHYDKKPENLLDYADMNMRYLRITGLVQRSGRGVQIVSTKHSLAEELAKSTASASSFLAAYQTLCNGARLPSDDIQIAQKLLDSMIDELNKREIDFDISDLDLNDVIGINTARRRLEDRLSKNDEILYAEQQRNQWREISDYMSLLIKGCGSKSYDDGERIIEIPKGDSSKYLEWTLWRAILAINHLKNKPYEVRKFSLDVDFYPVSAASKGKSDLYCEFEDFVIVIEVTSSNSYTQEAVDGDPVRRHIAEAVSKYNKPVFGLFIANQIDTNTAETFRHGVWYLDDDTKMVLDIVPLTLAQFQKFFDTMFEEGDVSPISLRDLIIACENKRNIVDAPAWKRHINRVVTTESSKIVCKEYAELIDSLSLDL